MNLILEECLTIKLREVKQTPEDDDAANNSMDVRQKQPRCFPCQRFSVFARVISTVRRFLLTKAVAPLNNKSEDIII